MPNIRDVAKMAGVSVTTVSRVLNNHPYVSEAKRQAVLEAIKQSNYQQNLNAVHLSMGKTFLIGVVVPYIDHPYFALLLKGMASEALPHNYNLVLFQTNYEKPKELDALQMLRQKQIDALVICSRTCDWSTMEEYIDDGRIILFEDTRGKKVTSTFVDHYKTFTYALEYLMAKGHRKIGYTLGRKTGANSMFRQIAFKDFMKKHQIPFEPSYIFDHCLHFEDGERVIRMIKQMSDPPTGDDIAAGIVTCASFEQIDIPGDLALIGFNNQPIAKMMNITTIEIPLEEIGRQLFLQAIAETNEIRHVEMAVKLIERNTL
jgi:DNA-binding LacI/PurR family transcriptional regulator